MTQVRDSSIFSENQSLFNREIIIHLDNSNLISSQLAEYHLYSVYKEFTESWMTACKLPINLGNVPIYFENLNFGNRNMNYQHFVAPGALLS